MTAVDVVIPVYNQARALRRCLRSLREQTRQDFTVTVVDDGSYDQPREAVTSFPRAVTVLEQDRMGAAAARNRGAVLGRSPFLLFCDADMRLQPTFLHRHLNTLQSHPNHSYAYANFKWGWKTFHPGPYDAERLRRVPYINTCALIRREHFPGFDERLKRFQDWDLWLTMLEHGYAGVWIPELLFTVRPGGTMSRWLPKAAYRLLPWLPTVKRYHEAMVVVKRKHHLY